MPSTPTAVVSSSCPTISRLLDKIAKDIMVCEHKTVRRWDGSIGEYKNYLRNKMLSAGAV